MRQRIAAVGVAVVLLALLPVPAHAAQVWNGNPALGKKVFGNIECGPPGSLIAAKQPEGFLAWRYTKKKAEPGNDQAIRCETRGVRSGGVRYSFGPGRTYYLGWSSKLSTVTDGDYSVFQWKSYGSNCGSGNGTQNYPVILKIRRGEARFFYVAPGHKWHLIWRTPVRAWTWHRYVVGLRTSADADKGWIELWFDGRQQRLGPARLLRYPGRTWDTCNEPKWGVYDRANRNLEAVNRSYGMKIGTTYADVSRPLRSEYGE